MSRRHMAMTTLLALCLATVALAGGPQLDPDLPKYAKVDGLRGTLNAAGSDTML